MLRHTIAGLLLATALPLGALAAENAEYLTWVRHYQVMPGMEREFVEAIKEVNGPLLDGLVNDQKIISWGLLHGHGTCSIH